MAQIKIQKSNKIEFDGKKYYVEQTNVGLRVGVVVINTITGQNPYVRWLPIDGKRAQRILSSATTLN